MLPGSDEFAQRPGARIQVVLDRVVHIGIGRGIQVGVKRFQVRKVAPQVLHEPALGFRLQVQHARTHAPRPVLAGQPHQRRDGSVRVGQPRQHRRHVHAHIQVQVGQFPNHAEAFGRPRNARLDPAREVRVGDGDGHGHAGPGSAGQVLQQVPVAPDQRGLGNQADGRARRQELAQTGLGEPQVTFHRLIRIGGRAHRYRRPLPARRLQLSAQPFGHVDLGEDHPLEVAAAVQVEVGMRLPRVAIPAGVTTAAVRVQAPAKRHAAHPVQRLTAGDLPNIQSHGTRLPQPLPRPQYRTFYEQSTEHPHFHAVRRGASRSALPPFNPEPPPPFTREPPLSRSP